MRYYFVQRLDEMFLIKPVLITPFLRVIDHLTKGLKLEKLN